MDLAPHAGAMSPAWSWIDGRWWNAGNAGLPHRPRRRGGGAPVVVQAMTNTDTADDVRTATADRRTGGPWSELVDHGQYPRPPAVPASASTSIDGLRRAADRRFSLQRPPPAERRTGLRRGPGQIPHQPGNVGFGKKKDEQFAQMVELACRYDKPVRIGVNWGSLDQSGLAGPQWTKSRRAEPLDAAEMMRQAMVASALESAAKAEGGRVGRRPDHPLRARFQRPGSDRHLPRWPPRRLRPAPGPTEAGMGSKGIVASGGPGAVLLQEGIGDTIRVSLTPEPGGSRSQEVIVAQEILQTMGLRAFTRWSQPVRAAAAPPAPCSRSWRASAGFRARQDAGMAPPVL